MRSSIEIFFSYMVVLIFFNSFALHASEYLISYRYIVKDMILYNESLQISHAMQHCIGSPQEFIEFAHRENKDLNKIIQTNSQEFIDFIHKVGLDVKYNSLTKNAQYTSTTVLTLKTTCFKVDFNDYFVKISPLK